MAGRPLRRYGSQGEQRAAVLALLFAERRVLLETGRNPPLMLLDDVMSELDATRRDRLTSLLRRGGQAVITTTELAHVPGAEDADVMRVAIAEGHAIQAAGGDAGAPGNDEARAA